MTLSNAEIFSQAREVADDACIAKFNETRPAAGNAAGEYWQLVFEATAAFLRKHINGQY